MKIFIATLGTETNTFAPMPTGLASFEETMLWHGDATSRTPNLFTEALHVWRREAEASQFQITESLATFAQPAGTTVGHVYESFRDEVCRDLEKAGGADIVLIQGHGAMVADGYDDCEGDLMDRLRAIAPDAVLGLLLDPHCHLTDRMMQTCDLIVCFKEYPHTDATPRAGELFRMAVEAARGTTKPVMRDFDCRMVNMYMTPSGPMRAYVDDMMAAEGSDGVLSLSLAHGFPWGDTERVGTRMLAITDNDAEGAARTAERFGRRLFDERNAICPALPTIDEALDRALQITGGPVVLADMADNAGGGAPSDSTFLLKALLERGLQNVASGIYWDPIVTRICSEAGTGARIDIRLGGKLGPMSGDPIDLTVTVMGVATRLRQPFGGGQMDMGNAVWLRTGGIDLVVNDIRTQTFHPNAFEALGIKLTERHLVCVKSTQHFQAGFAPIASEVISVATPGAITPDFGAIPFTKRDPNYWPRVVDPWKQA